MGLPVSVLLRGPSARGLEAASAVQAVYEELRNVDAVFSTWRHDSEVSRLSRGEVAVGDCSDDVRLVAARCEQARTDTAGLFDAARPEGGWDPSGLVKGWAVERASRHLAGLPLDWCLNAGGDVLVQAPSGEAFGIGIADPRDPTGVLALLHLTSGAVATSGTAARGAHLWDPRTGKPALSVSSVTVSGPTLLEADVLATSAFVAGDLALLADRPLLSGLLVHPDGRTEATSSWSGQPLKVPAVSAEAQAWPRPRPYPPAS